MPIRGPRPSTASSAWRASFWACATSATAAMPRRARIWRVAAYTPVGELTSGLLIAWTHAGEGELNLALKALDRLDRNESLRQLQDLPRRADRRFPRQCHSRRGLLQEGLRTGRAPRCASCRPMATSSSAAAARDEAQPHLRDLSSRATTTRSSWRRSTAPRPARSRSHSSQRRAPVPPRRCSRWPPR